MLVLAGLILLWLQAVVSADSAHRSPKEILASVDILIAQRKLDSARVTLRTALTQDSTNADLWLGLAKVEKLRGRVAARSDALQRVFRLKPSTVEGRLELVPDLLDRRQSDSASFMALQICALTRSRDPMGWYLLGRAYQQSAKFDSASVVFQKAYSLLGPKLF
jgi:cytochrome c-type biogenesis protein CcmH/NrfG